MDEDVVADIMEGTYCALCEHGYADLTMQDIADETARSKAALHYHYDSKRELLVAFLDYLYAEFTEAVADPAGEDAAARLSALVDAVLSPPGSDPERRREFQTALLELKAQAPYDEALRERLGAFDEFLAGEVRSVVVGGIEAGEFRDVDPDDTARFFVTALTGAMTRRVTAEGDAECARRMLDSFVETHLVAGAQTPGEPEQEADADRLEERAE